MWGALARAVDLRRIAASLLLFLFAGALVQPVVASFAEPTCDMPCCKSGSHKGSCCCRRKPAQDQPNTPRWRSAPSCSPGCARVALGFSPLIAAAAPAARASAVEPMTLRQPRAIVDVAPRPQIWRHALFQRPPPLLAS
jgi:hypothetical protein